LMLVYDGMPMILKERILTHKTNIQHEDTKTPS
jgi:hypothetical protein